MLRACFTQVQ